MKVIIYGTGETAKQAFSFIGFGRVNCFAINNIDEEREIYKKKIIDYSTMINEAKASNKCIIIIAAENHWIEMQNNLLRDGVSNFFVFHNSDQWKINEILPSIDFYGRRIWKSYTELLSACTNLKFYKKIAVYGENEYLIYLLLEVMSQAPESQIYILSSCKKNDYLGCKYVDIECASTMDLVIMNVQHHKDGIRNIIDVGNAQVLDLYYSDFQCPSFHNYEIEKLKNQYIGKRCFVVATGPSLRIEDLDILYNHNEICISVNKIYRCFSATKWRPNYVGMTDPKIVADFIKDRNSGMEIPNTVFIGDNSIHAEPREVIEGVEYFHLNYKEFEPELPLFSDDMSKGSYMGCTVTYDFALQMAAYMGFSEIYLLGVDHTMTGNISDSKNHFIENYYTEDEKDENHFNPSNWDGATKAYMSAEIYSRKHGFRIFNATRGGKLEVFERVDFDSLFE